MMANKNAVEMYFTITMLFKVDPLKILNQYLFYDFHNTNPLICRNCVVKNAAKIVIELKVMAFLRLACPESISV
ncbi:hypothetical protein Xedl_02764 [Xenorhabdus eapokensis]|uniref:Uncharacterized protein n=1 Tax=Xenorhabdus eapokensis TaxID=1873482 RepID=A0A1Q5TNH8_9GAMM|nr:hypothetical protein Xedl_02764 [Xenorhabdus eapokensis]